MVVKFVQSYNSKAHHLLADNGLAPRLLYCAVDDPSAHFFGRLRLIVMDFIQGITAHDAMHVKKLGETVFSAVERGIGLLHSNNFVFGDLRPPNIVIGLKGVIMLVDFDWCSIEGLGRYPPTLNKDATEWHEGVEGNGIMMKIHDLTLLDNFRAKCF